MRRILRAGSFLLSLAFAAPALAQIPGSAGNSSLVELREPVQSGPPGTLTPYVTGTAQTLVKSGYLVLLEVRVNARDPATWRNVVVFSGEKPDCASYGYSNTVTLISRAAGETGISNVDLMRLITNYSPPVTTDEIAGLMGTGCVSIMTNQPSGINVYTAGSAVYHIYTNPDQTTPANSPSWGRLKITYR